jgi:hypothetical protein
LGDDFDEALKWLRHVCSWHWLYGESGNLITTLPIPTITLPDYPAARYSNA